MEAEKGNDSLELAKVSMNLGKVHSLLGENKQAKKRLKKSLKTTECMQEAYDRAHRTCEQQHG